MDAEWDEGVEGVENWIGALPARMMVPVVGVSFAPSYPANLAILEEWMESTGRELPVQLVRDPLNPHDSNAIRVEVEGTFIGHVPRNTAARLASVMDDGQEWAARVGRVSRHPSAPDQPGITIEVYRTSQG